MASAADLGISEQEFQDAMNLEKIYSLVNSAGKCAKCSNMPTHVDCNAYQFLCASHSTGRGNCKRIGDDRFATFEIDKLQRKFGGSNRSGHPSTSPALIRSSRADKHHQGRSRHKKKRSPSPETEESSSLSEEFSRPKSSRIRKSKASSRPAYSSAFDDDFMNVQQYPPGMAGIFMQQRQQQPNLLAENYSSMPLTQPQQGWHNSGFPPTTTAQTNRGGSNLMGFTSQPGYYTPQHSNFYMPHQGDMSGGAPGMFNTPPVGRLGQSNMPMQQPSVMGSSSSFGQSNFMGQQNMMGQPSAYNQAYLMGQANMHRPANRPEQYGSSLFQHSNYNFQAPTSSGIGMTARPTNPFANNPTSPPNYPDLYNNRPFGMQSSLSAYGQPPNQYSGRAGGNMNAQQGSGQSFLSTGGNDNYAMMRAHASNPYQFNSLQGIPNPSASQRDWWD